MNVAFRRTLTAAFILASLIGPTRVALAQVEEEPPTIPPAENVAEDDDASAEPDDLRPERIKVHDIGLGYHAVMFRTESSDRYALHGPTVVHNYFIGRRWGYVMRAAVYFPLTGRMNGPSGEFRGTLRELYSQRHLGFDGLFGFGRRLPINDRLTITASVGVHIQSFSTSGTEVSPVEAITMGVAGTGRLEYRLTGILHFGAEFMAGIDPIDLIKHQNRAVYTIPLAGVLSLGIDL